MDGKSIRFFMNEDLGRLTKRFIRVCIGVESLKKFPKELLVGNVAILDEKIDRKIAIIWDIIAEKFLNFTHFKSSYCNFEQLINTCMESLDKNAGEDNDKLDVLLKDIKKNIRFKKSENEEMIVIVEESSGDVFDERYALFYLKKMYDSLNYNSKMYVNQSFVQSMFKGMAEVLETSRYDTFFSVYDTVEDVAFDGGESD